MVCLCVTLDLDLHLKIWAVLDVYVNLKSKFEISNAIWHSKLYHSNIKVSVLESFGKGSHVKLSTNYLMLSLKLFSAYEGRASSRFGWVCMSCKMVFCNFWMWWKGVCSKSVLLKWNYCLYFFFPASLPAKFYNALHVMSNRYGAAVVRTPFFTMRAATEYWVESLAAPLPFDFQASSRMEIICFLSSMVIWVSVSSPAICAEIQVEIQIVKQ